MAYAYWSPLLGRREDIKRILEKMGLTSIDDLYKDIPEDARLKTDWDTLEIGRGKPLTELEVSRIMESHLKNIQVFNDPPPFAGGGAWPHYVPKAVWEAVLRGEFLTAYTPYQAEISQGLLQALFEYQSLMAELLDMEVVNASMYDGASAAGEAFLQALRLGKGKHKILVPETMNPQYYRVASLYVKPHGSIVKVGVDSETGYLNIEDLHEKLTDDVAAVYLEYPSYLGVIDEHAELIGEIAHKRGALFIMGIDPIAVALYKPPGELGADIAVGDGQPLGLGLNYGGPSLGIYAVRWKGKLVRQMPGRLVGLTEDRDGNRAYALILQTREQHIRRAKATSNITTNQAFMAIVVAAYLAYMGGHGLRRIAETILYNTLLVSRRLSSIGITAPLVEGEVWRDIPVRLPEKRFADVQTSLLEKGILVGPRLHGLTSWLEDTDGIIAVTEIHTRDDIEKLIDSLTRVLGGGSNEHGLQAG